MVDKSDARVKRMFGAIAPQYDRMNHLLSLNVDRYWRWRTVRLAQPAGAGPILDVCTGTGDLAFAFDRYLGGRTPVFASDFCREMLDLGEAKKDRYGAAAGQVRFLEADAQALPFDDNQFEVVSVAFGLRNVADTDRGLREMTRVCRPAGRVAVLEFSMPQWQPFRSLYGVYFRNVLPRIGELLARNAESAYEYLPASVGEFPSGEPLAARMREAGLSDVRMHPFTGGVATLYLGHK